MLTITQYRGPATPAIKPLTAKVSFAGYSLHNFRTHKVFPRPRDLRILDIQRAVADFYKIPIREMWSARRAHDIAHPRQVAMYLCRRHTKRSLPEIGRRFGNRDHTTVIHAIRAVEKRCMLNGEILTDVRQLSSSFGPEMEIGA